MIKGIWTMKRRAASLIAAIALSATLRPSAVAWAQGDGWTAKVLVLNGAPADVVAAFQGAYVGDPQAADPGAAHLQSTTPVLRDGKPTELFVPVRMATAVWIWDEYTTYHFLGNVRPAGSLDPVEIDARLLVGQRTPTAQRPATYDAGAVAPPVPRNEHTVKLLVHNAAAGQVISVFEGDGDSSDPGAAMLRSTMPAALDGKPTELFAPVGMASSVWIWSEQTGYRFLGKITPGQKSPPIEFTVIVQG